MTFEQFQATRRTCDDLANAVNSAPWGDEPAKGNLYLDCLYIEHVEPHWPENAKAEGEWYLLLGRCEWISNDLVALERRLYDWAASEGYFDVPGPLFDVPCPLAAADARMAAEDDAHYPERDE